ncbi:methyl-accepting chemotaxis protein [Calothrix rhizosoleniae]|uniref:methyl-accepting chemotaxis protein n=1 Tax=Calothrix rhizosoleniae TaxID=888997 RepID=UPI000B498447|nr:methyl-accepting chemotaxis protein [Calothrix rhizosoleniae]
MINRINLETHTSPRKRIFSHKQRNHATEIETVIQPSVYPHNFSVHTIISWIKNTELRTKAIIFAVAIGVLPILGVGVATYSLVNKSVTRQITNNKQANALWILDNIENYLKNREQEIKLLTNYNWISSTQIKGENSLANKKLKLNNWHSIHSAYDSINIVDIRGNIVIQTHHTNTFNNQARESFFQEILNTKKPIIRNLWVDKNIHKSKIYLALPAIDPNTKKIKYIVETIIPLKNIEQIIQHPQILQDQYYLLDTTGKIFLSNHHSGWGKNIEEIFSNWQKQENNHIFTRILNNKHNHREELATFIPWTNIKGLPDPQWKLILSTDKAIAFTTQEQLLLILVMGTIVTAMLVGVAVIIIVNRLTSPIVTATMAVKKLSKGNFTTRINVKGDDEIAALGASINRMADQLQDLQNNQLAEAERLELFTNILIAIRQSLHSDDLLNQAVSKSRVALEAHRVVIYHFNSHNSLQVLAESVAPGVTIKSGKSIENIGIIQELVELCQQHGLIAVNNVLEKELAPKYLQLMQKLKIKATLVTPILKDNQIFGFLIADYCWAPHIWQYFEINFLSQLAVQVGLSLERVSLLEHTQALKELATHMSGSLNSQDIYNLAVEDIQKALQVERVLICKLDEDLQAHILHSSPFANPDPENPSLAANLDICLPDQWVKNYLENWHQQDVEVQEIDGLQLASSTIDANLVVPILLNDQLFGLLIAHDISRIRVWQQSEIDLLEQLARHIGLALERANVLENSLQTLSQSEKSLEQQTNTNRELQLHLQQLHSAIAEIANGDLTVRAEVSDGEIGAVAKFVNAIADRLQEIVIQIKVADRQVNTAIAENSGAISQLAIAALKQSEEITRTLDAVESMRLSMKDVATNAQQAITITHVAACSTEDDRAAIKLTIDRFLSLGKTIIAAVDQIQDIGESAREISHMVSSLNKIAAETNLVAINAGLEATRMGAKDQEFTLLAEEIATLTAKVASTTTEIHHIASNLQQQTTETGKILELESIQITEGSHLLSNNWLSFNRIADAYCQIDRLMQSIDVATTSQVETSKEVTNAMKKIAKVSKMTGNSSRQFSTSLQKTVEISQQMQAKINKLQAS